MDDPYQTIANGGIIVHEWIAPHGGSENVLAAMMDSFPAVKVVCLWNDSKPDDFDGARIQETWLARSPFRRRKAIALLTMPLTWRCRPAVDANWALVSTHLFAHHVRFRNQHHSFAKIAYVHTPARYIWEPALDVRGGNFFARVLAPAFKRIDKFRAQEAVSVAANSEYVRKRIEATWGRSSRVIYPPVDVDRIQSEGDWTKCLRADEAALITRLPPSFVLGASRFVPYKRLLLVLLAAEEAGSPVVLAGSGPQERFLRDAARSLNVPVVFIDTPSDEMLYSLYQLADVFVFPAVEDFGIMPVEAMACGTPVVVSALGGSSESLPSTGGCVAIVGHEPKQWAAAISYAIQNADPGSIANHAKRFRRQRFVEEIRSWVTETVRMTVDKPEDSESDGSAGLGAIG